MLTIDDQKRQAAHKALADAVAARKADATDGAPIRAVLVETAKPKKRSTPASVALSPAAAEVRAKYMTRLEFCAAMRIGETRFHEYVRRGIIKTVKIGRSVLVPVTECDALILRIAAA